MQEKTTVCYTLGEAEKPQASRGTQLDHACRKRRPFKRLREEMISFKGRSREEMVTLRYDVYLALSSEQ